MVSISENARDHVAKYQGFFVINSVVFSGKFGIIFGVTKCFCAKNIGVNFWCF